MSVKQIKDSLLGRGGGNNFTNTYFWISAQSGNTLNKTNKSQHLKDSATKSTTENIEKIIWRCIRFSAFVNYTLLRRKKKKKNTKHNNSVELTNFKVATLKTCLKWQHRQEKSKIKNASIQQVKALRISHCAAQRLRQMEHSIIWTEVFGAQKVQGL